MCKILFGYRGASRTSVCRGGTSGVRVTSTEAPPVYDRTKAQKVFQETRNYPPTCVSICNNVSIQSTTNSPSSTGYLRGAWTFLNKTLQTHVLIVYHRTEEFPLRLDSGDLMDIVDQAKNQSDSRLVMLVMLTYCICNFKSWPILYTLPIHGYISSSCSSIWEMCLNFNQCRIVSQESVWNGC